MRKIIFLLFLFITYSISAQHPLRIAVISDTHYLSPKLAITGGALQNFELATGRNIKDLHQVLDEVFSDLHTYQPDVLLIAGDITNHGERDSHIDFAAKLKSFIDNGTRIFVVPGNHDVNVPNAVAYIGNKPTPTPTLSADEFQQIYAPYGFANATKRDDASLSYLAELNDSTWLLCIDSNRYKEHTTSTISGGRILPETMQWVLEILQEAKSKDVMVMGMMHHGLVEHMPYQATFMPNYLIENWEKDARILADNGLQIMFTGHFHSNDITLLTTPKGNTIYDIETGSLAGYPFPYRLMKLQNRKLTIESVFIDSIPGNPNLLEEYRLKTKKIVYRMARSKIASMSLPIPEETKNTLIDLIVKMQMLHMKGDEKMDAEMLQMIELLKELLGDSTTDISSFELDFPPADNFVEIAL